MSFNFNPMKYAKTTERKGAAITEEVKAEIVKYVRVSAASLNKKLEELNECIAKIDARPKPTGADAKIVLAARVREKRNYADQKAPFEQALRELADRWKNHRDEQWTGMNAYQQIERYTIEEIPYIRPFYFINRRPEEAVTVKTHGKPVKCLCAHTTDVILEDDGRKYNLGPYKIVIPLYLVAEQEAVKDSSSIQFIPIRHLDPEWIKVHGEDHPKRFPHHMWDAAGYPYTCWSEFGTVVSQLMINCDIVSVLSVCVRFQFNWNPSSPFGGCRPAQLPHAQAVTPPTRQRPSRY